MVYKEKNSFPILDELFSFSYDLIEVSPTIKNDNLE